jgi:hypothetical protein
LPRIRRQGDGRCHSCRRLLRHGFEISCAPSAHQCAAQTDPLLHSYWTALRLPAHGLPGGDGTAIAGFSNAFAWATAGPYLSVQTPDLGGLGPKDVQLLDVHTDLSAQIDKSHWSPLATVHGERTYQPWTYVNWRVAIEPQEGKFSIIQGNPPPTRTEPDQYVWNNEPVGDLLARDIEIDERDEHALFLTGLFLGVSGAAAIAAAQELFAALPRRKPNK